jgi:hypothetical protein
MPDIFRVDNAQLYYRNFSGENSKYNTGDKKDRNFGVFLDEGVAEEMARDGWAIKTTRPGEDEEVGRPYINVKVGYKIRPPKIIMITETARTPLTEDTVGVLDWADIQLVDLICNASYWEHGDKTGVAAYLKTMYVTIEEDELEKKYAVLSEDEA